jgi:hypothetical protein
MSKFGWSLPPGCGTLPGEEEVYCEVCGKHEDKCICPECPVCGDTGNSNCYPDHMQLSDEQIKSKEQEEAKWEEKNHAEFEAENSPYDLDQEK